MRFYFKTFFLLCVFISTGTSFAATATPPPATVADAVGQIQNLSNFYDAGRVAQTLQQSLHHLPKAGPQPQINAPQQSAGNNADKIHFKLNKVIIKGSSIYDKLFFGKIFASSIHHEISLSQLQKMVHTITVQYHQDGYILSRALLPPQTIKGGIVIVQIVEGFVSDVTVKGDVGGFQPLLLAYGSHIMQSRPLQIKVLERYALLANDLPGLVVQSVLNPSAHTPAGAELSMVVTSRSRASAYVSYDDYGTRYIGPTEISVGASLYSILTPGDSNNVRISYATRGQELHFFEFVHAQPLGGNGMRWQLGTDYTTTRPEFVLQPLKIIGRNFLIFTDLSYPLIRDRGNNFTIHSTFNYENVTSSIIGLPFYQDRIRSLVLGMNLDYIDSLRGLNTITFETTHGFPFWGAHDHELQSRPNGQASYTRMNSSYSRLQGLNSHCSLYGLVRGQYSNVPLLATEQYGVGGPDVGRGYDPSEIVGDKGISGKIELRLDFSPGLRLLQAIEYYVFYDFGVIYNIDHATFPQEQSLVSTGVGARFSFLPNLSGNFVIARPLSRPVATLFAIGHNPNSVRTFFQIAATT